MALLRRVFSFLQSGFPFSRELYILGSTSIPGSTPLRRGVAFGALVFLVGGLPGNLGNFILLNLPVALSLSWTVETLVASLAGGAVIGLLLK